MIPAILALLVCALAFLLASTPAHNSDVWLHLASGRLLSAGQLPDGTDPFSSATRGVFWVNPSWLSDLVLYQLYRLGGGTALVIAKAVLVVLLAALLLAFRRRGSGMEVPAVAGFAAVLALGPWLLLQSSLLSLLGVVLTLYLLERPGLLEGSRAGKARRERWLLVPLFALWANLDGWFVLGPVLVGLYAVGELISALRSPSLTLRLPLSVLTLAGLAACLATPYHYRTLAWPVPLGLTHTEQALRNDPLGQTLILSPFAGRFATSAVFRSSGAWAYSLLLLSSAASFALSIRTLHLGRFLVWLILAGLSIYQARTIPIFVVAAAPLLILNVQEWVSRRPFSESLYQLRITVQRLSVLIGSILLILAWPGWLQPAPYQPRGWTVEPDGSLVRLADVLNHWHTESRFRSDRFALTFSPEVAHYLAWSCPAEKGFVDSRWPLFERVVDDYVRMRHCLLREDGTDTVEELASLLDAHQIDRILLYDADWERIERAYRRLFLARSEWELMAVEGGAALFRRRSAETPSPEAFDYRRIAYHPAVEMRAPAAPRSPRPPGWFDPFFRRRAVRSADREEAALHLLSFDLTAEQRHREVVRQWLLSQATGLIGCGWGVESAGSASVLALRLHLTPLLPSSGADGRSEDAAAAEQLAAVFLSLHEGGPSEPLLAAVRAARRALALDADDAGAYLLLGEAYFRLGRKTHEAGELTMVPDLIELRRTQTLTALEQAAVLQPHLDPAHALLARLYYEAGQMDRCLDHLRARRRILDQAIAHGGPEAAAAAQRRDALQADLDRMEEVVDRSEKTYQANLAGKTEPSKVLERARLAARYGLSRKALELLLESFPAIFGKDGVEYELDLMLKAGQGYQVRDWLTPEHEKQIGFALYHRLKARAAASCGDYAAADAELDRNCEPLRRIGIARTRLVPVRSAVALHVGRAVLTRPSAAEGVAGLASALRFQFEALNPLQTPARMLREEADQQVLRGLLALEFGEVEKAEQHFRAAVQVWSSDSAAAAGAGLDFSSRPIAQQMLRRLQE